MGMTIHQSGRDPRPAQSIRSTASASDGKSERLPAKAMQPSRAAIEAVLDHTEPGQIPPDRGEPGVEPDSIEALGRTALLGGRSLTALCLYIHKIVLVFCPAGLETYPLISHQRCSPRGGLMTCRWW